MGEQSKNSGGLKVPVTVEHVDRALRAMTKEVTNLSQYGVDYESAFIAGAIIANMEALDERMKMSSLLMAVVHEVLGNYVPLWASENYGLADPADEEPQGKREKRGARRTSTAKAA